QLPLADKIGRQFTLQPVQWQTLCTGSGRLETSVCHAPSVVGKNLIDGRNGQLRWRLLEKAVGDECVARRVLHPLPWAETVRGSEISRPQHSNGKHAVTAGASRTTMCWRRQVAVLDAVGVVIGAHHDTGVIDRVGLIAED